MKNEFDELWLNTTILTKVMAGYHFYIEVKHEDQVSLRLRSEILHYGGHFVNQKEQATLVFLTKAETETETFTITKTAEITTIEGDNNVALLYGFYVFARRLILKQPLHNYMQKPSQNLRMLNHWDRLDGSIERGYAGNSIFYKDNQFCYNHKRIEHYARLMASIGLNAISINNVNVHGEATHLLTEAKLKQVAEIAAIFNSFGIKVFLAINFASPMRLGNLTTSDPLAEDVKTWWQEEAKLIYSIMPKFGGFIVKADSEDEPGPFMYGRNHADGANMLARALKPFNGLVIWRTFVYNAYQDWRDRKTDRARAAYDHFMPLDGTFDNNVTLQIKFGPIDFQTREPLHPLFGALKKTNHIMEFQITAEYLGHQIDINYAVSQWKSLIDFNTKHSGVSVVKDLLKANSPVPAYSGFAAVVGVGLDKNWMGNALAVANLYGYGRMAEDNNLSSDDILKEWLELTFCASPNTAKQIIFDIMQSSNKTYENYTAPLAVGFMVKTHLHYGVAVNDYEYDRWGTYHFADRYGVGVDRTVATGTGYAGLYAPSVAKQYETPASMEDELLLFFHHLAYTHKLHSGKTLIQHIYDSHFEGYNTVLTYQKQWDTLQGQIDEEIFVNVQERLIRQEKNAREWRDQVNTYFYRMSGINDELDRQIFR